LHSPLDCFSWQLPQLGLAFVFVVAVGVYPCLAVAVVSEHHLFRVVFLLFAASQSPFVIKIFLEIL